MLNQFSIFPISLKLRLLITITIIMIIGLIVGGSFILNNAREAVQSEIESSIELAEKLITETINSGSITYGESFSYNNVFGMQMTIEQIRHVKMIVEHQYLNPSDKEQFLIDGVPAWFAQRVYPVDDLPEKIIVHGQGSENLIIAADPADEIREVWQDVRDLLLLSLALFISSLLLIYFAISHGLKPLKALQAGFEQLEKNNLGIRINEQVVPELAPIHRRFNQTVSILQQTTQEKQELSRKLITLQEDERSQISRELHDEVGPYLFSIRITTSGIKQLNEQDQNNKKEIDKRLTSIDQTVEQLQLHIRQLLKKLRPMILNDLSLEDALVDLIKLFKATEPRINWKLNYTVDMDLNDTINVTIYRIIQECLTNIGRHANARNASVNVLIEHHGNEHSDESSNLIVIVEDDGRGLQKEKTNGLGLRGIKERVQALGGHFEIKNGHRDGQVKGLTIFVELPVSDHIAISNGET